MQNTPYEPLAMISAWSLTGTDVVLMWYISKVDRVNFKEFLYSTFTPFFSSLFFFFFLTPFLHFAISFLLCTKSYCKTTLILKKFDNFQRSHMSRLTGMDIYFKKEFLQYTGSFKERGARYTLMMLPQVSLFRKTLYID